MNDRLATARWEDPAEVSRKYRYSFRNFWLGRAHDGAPVGYLDDRHICLVSGTRGGKGASVIVNNLCYWPGSAVVIDPKGENATVTAARRGQGDAHCEGMGQAVHVLDPFNTAIVDSQYRSRFNPLDALDPSSEDSIDEAGRLANALIVINDAKAETYFDEAARGMVKALILHVLTCPDFLPEERHLPMVRDLLKRGDWQVAELMRSQAAAEGRTAEEADDPQLLLWRSVEINPAFGGILAGDGAQFRGLLSSTPKTYYSVLQAALINTEFLDSPPMRRALTASDFRLADLKTDPRGLTLYLSLPQHLMDTHYRWLRMMVALTVAQMQLTRGKPASGSPVLMVLDEFAGLKRMSAIETAVAQLAGFGVKLFFVLQSLEQLKATYKDAWETFLSNAGLKMFFSIEDNFTREYVSKQIGETEIVRYMQSENAGTSETDSLAEGRTRSDGITQSYSRTRSTGETSSQGTTRSTASGRTHSDTFGSSETFNQGWNTSKSVSSSEGRNWGTSRSKTTGTSSTQSETHGSTYGSSWGPGGGSTSSSWSSSSGSSYGTNESETEGTSEGGSYSTTTGTTNGTSGGVAKGTSQSAADGLSFTDTTGTSDTLGRSTTSGESETTGRSTTIGDSRTVTHGTGRTKGTGRAETIHRRPLLRPEEIGQLFARLEKAHPLYPGMALVLVGGGHPLMVRRSHYFEDPQFIDCFSPHPDHAFELALEARVEGLLPLIGELEAAMDGRRVEIAEWLTYSHAMVSGGDRLARLDDTPWRGESLYLYAPCTGKALKFGVATQRTIGAAALTDPLLSVKYYAAAGGVQWFDALADLRAACERLRKPKPVLAALPAEPLESPIDTALPSRGLNRFVMVLLYILIVLVIVGLILWQRAHKVHYY